MKAIAAGCLSACMIVAASAKADPVQIKFAYPSAPNNALFQGMQGWADDVNKAANGAIEIKLFPGGVIADNSNMYDRVTGGVADIGFAVFGPVSSVFPRPMSAPCPSRHAITAKTRWRSGRFTRKASSRTSSPNSTRSPSSCSPASSFIRRSRSIPSPM